MWLIIINSEPGKICQSQGQQIVEHVTYWIEKHPFILNQWNSTALFEIMLTSRS